MNINRDTVIAQLTSTKVTSFVDSLRPMFKDLPHLPLKVKDILVQIIPWLAALGAVASAIGGVRDILLSFGIRHIDVMPGNNAYLLIIGVLNLVAAYIAFLSFPLLKDRNHIGWVLLFWSTVLSVLMSLISVIFGVSALIGAILGALVGLYLTFEVEPAYTASGKVADIAKKVIKSNKKLATK